MTSFAQLMMAMISNLTLLVRFEIHFYFYTKQAFIITQFTPYSGEKWTTQACLADDDHISYKPILEDKSIGKCLINQLLKVM